MGLDMYLNARKTLSPRRRTEKKYIDYFESLNEPDFNKEGGMYLSSYNQDHISMLAHLETLPKLLGQIGEIESIIKDGNDWIVKTEAGYWRKANQIHTWFVEVCQDGVDDCQSTLIHPADLMGLLSTIRTIGKNKSLARDMLPSQSGFFFGSTDYNDWYFDDLKETKRILRKVLRKSTISNWDVYYQASW
jgi:hypothetical protein